MKAKIIAICSVLAIAIVLMCYVVFVADTDVFKPKTPQDDKNYAYADPSVKNPNKENSDGSKFDDYEEELPPDPNQQQESSGENNGSGNSGGNNTGNNGNNGNNNNNNTPTIKSIIGKEKSFSFSVKGVSISMPMRYGDLKSKLGMLVMEDFEQTIAAGGKVQATAFLLDASSIDTEALMNGQLDTSKLGNAVTTLTIGIENLTSKSISVQDATVTSVSVVSGTQNVSMSKGITGNSTSDAITSIYGTPDNDIKLGMRLMYYKLLNLTHHGKEVGVEITSDLNGAVKMIRYGTFDPTYESAIKFLLENGEKILTNDLITGMLTGQGAGNSSDVVGDLSDIGNLFGDFLNNW